MTSAWKLDGTDAKISAAKAKPKDNDIFGTEARRTAAANVPEEKDLDLNATEAQILTQI